MLCIAVQCPLTSQQVVQCQQALFTVMLPTGNDLQTTLACQQAWRVHHA